MNEIRQHIAAIRQHIPDGVTLVCVSKFHPADAIRQAYDAGERDFGESRVQELVVKHRELPADIRWHMIGHLQTNKVRDIVPFVHLIQSVDSIHLLDVINAEAARIGRTVNVLLEVHVAREETKSGFSIEELTALLTDIHSGVRTYPNVHIAGLMTMATNTDDETEIRRCFREAHLLSTLNPQLSTISMGMSDDYILAISEGSNMVRIGTTIFGERQY